MKFLDYTAIKFTNKTMSFSSFTYISTYKVITKKTLKTIKVYSTDSDKTFVVVDPKGYPWSSPLSITNFNEQFIRIPYFGEVRVLVVDAVRTILVIVESVSQVEISARDIRVRLTMRDSSQSSHTILDHKTTSENKLAAESTTTLPTSIYHSAEDMPQSVSETALVAFSLPPLVEKSNLEILHVPSELKKHWSDLDVRRSMSKSLHQISTIPLRSEWSSLNVNVFVKSVNVVFTLDLEEGGIERTEIANFTCNDLSLTALQKDVRIFIF